MKDSRDGVFIDTRTSFTGSKGNGTGAVNIGRRGDGAQNFSGLFNDVRLIYYTLTKPQIRIVMSGGAVNFR